MEVVGTPIRRPGRALPRHDHLPKRGAIKPSNRSLLKHGYHQGYIKTCRCRDCGAHGERLRHDHPRHHGGLARGVDARRGPADHVDRPPCRTPCTLELKRNKGFSVTVERDGYEPAQSNVEPSASGWGFVAMLGNVVFGGLPGVIVDAFSGATMKLEPNPYVVSLAEVPAPAPSTPSGQPLAMRPRALTSAIY